jgi:hypothetical protein
MVESTALCSSSGDDVNSAMCVCVCVCVCVQNPEDFFVSRLAPMILHQILS